MLFKVRSPTAAALSCHRAQRNMNSTCRVNQVHHFMGRLQHGGNNKANEWKTSNELNSMLEVTKDSRFCGHLYTLRLRGISHGSRCCPSGQMWSTSQLEMMAYSGCHLHKTTTPLNVKVTGL